MQQYTTNRNRQPRYIRPRSLNLLQQTIHVCLPVKQCTKHLSCLNISKLINPWWLVETSAGGWTSDTLWQQQTEYDTVYSFLGTCLGFALESNYWLLAAWLGTVTWLGPSCINPVLSVVRAVWEYSSFYDMHNNDDKINFRVLGFHDK